MLGKIIKGVGGLYYVDVEDGGIYECTAKGAFRNEGIKPLVGDNVEIAVTKEEDRIGNIVEIMPRTSEMIRPASANVDQALIIFAVKHPDPNYNLLDRFLIYMESLKVECKVCFNKEDLCADDEMDMVVESYRNAGYEVVTVSTVAKSGIDELRKMLEGRTTVVAGPSGVGKSSIINLLSGHEHMEVGEISRKNERGKHTTRHSELICIGRNSFIMDTPGFTSLDIFGATKDNLRDCYAEFADYGNQCRYLDCTHTNEPGCTVREAVENGKISKLRYGNYVQLYEELRNKKKVY